MDARTSKTGIAFAHLYHLQCQKDVTSVSRVACTRLQLYDCGARPPQTDDLKRLQVFDCRRLKDCRWLALPNVDYRHNRWGSESGQHSGTPYGFHLTAVGLLTGLLASRSVDEEELHSVGQRNGFPKIVQCAEAPRVILHKERQAAIRSLEVVADVAQEAQPAVVSITSMDKGFLARHTQSTGSGFIIDDAGHVVTNAHVVGYRTNVFVHLSDGRSFPGRVLAVDMSSDLALIRLDVKEEISKALPQLALAPDLKLVRPGHFVLALGSPLMLANSVTVGVVSALDRDLGHSEGLKYIQTDAIITFGNSGGPLVNLMGEVIGVNSMVAGTGVGFAIPVDQVRNFVQIALQAAARSGKSGPIGSGSRRDARDSHILTESGTTPSGAPARRYLGLVMRTLTPELAFELGSRGGPQFMDVTEGVLIHAIMRNSPAHRFSKAVLVFPIRMEHHYHLRSYGTSEDQWALPSDTDGHVTPNKFVVLFISVSLSFLSKSRAGLMAGDVIVAIDGLPITNAQQVYAAAENREELSITILRRGQRIEFPNIRTEKA
ncbi:serine protease HTRA2 mitochondrial [Clonorchis sinensis]|uniref:Serine protease HTRA2 mitochondrial n=1 Tax=Clonorchis sinensis TaxID=79923 RepID=G7Y595_CLOSI|nr:serine protease HTRA2 mitochondrial [Clonorchis sinensis]